MVIPINIRQINAGAQSSFPTLTELRQRRLERLYQRKHAVESLIQSLECYRDTRPASRCEPRELPSLRAGQR